MSGSGSGFGASSGPDGGSGDRGAARSSIRVDGRPPATSELELGPTPPRARSTGREAFGPGRRSSDPDGGATESAAGASADAASSAEPTTAELFIDLSAASGMEPRSSSGSTTDPTATPDSDSDKASDRTATLDSGDGPAKTLQPSDDPDHHEPGGPLVAALASLSAETASASGAASAGEPAVSGRGATAVGGVGAARTVTDTGSFEPVTIGSGVGRSRAAGGRRARSDGSADVSLWRRVGFGLMILILVGSIPVLARTGYRIVTETTDGIYTDHTLSPEDPGYEVLVDPTPTALVIQTDDQGTPTSLTFVALNEEAGGSLVFIPLDTEVAVRAYGVDRLRTVYAAFADRPATARAQLADQVARILNVAIEEVIELDDRSWAQLVQPLGTLDIVNPDPVSTETHDFPAGPIQLTPDEVGPYLNAATLGESDLSRLVRHQVLWGAWLDARAQAVDPEEDPASRSAVGTVATHLAAGDVEMGTLPVLEGHDEDDLWVLIPESDSVLDLMARSVPAPLAPVPGSRASVRLLNGVAAEPISPQVMGAIVRAQGSIAVLGNATSFGHDTTSIVYNDPAVEPFVDAIIEALGVDADPSLDLEAPDTVDITVTLGRDISPR